MKRLGEILADMGLVPKPSVSIAGPDDPQPRAIRVVADAPLPETIDACRRALETAPRRTIQRRES